MMVVLRDRTVQHSLGEPVYACERRTELMRDIRHEVFIPDNKEPSFFAQCYENGWDWYANLFAEARDGQRTGEGSTFYSSSEFAEIACFV